MPATCSVDSRRELLQKAKSILIIQLGDIGDVVWATPTLRALKTACPRTSLSVLVRAGSGALLEADPSVDGIFEVRRYQRFRERVAGQLQLVRSLRRERFDAVLDLRSDERGAIMAFLSGAPMRGTLFHRDAPFWRNRAFTHLVIPPPPPKRIRGAAEQSLALIREFGVETDNPAPRLWILEEVKERVRRLVEAENLQEGGWATLNPFSRWSYKEWEIGKWARIIDWLGSEHGIAAVIVGSAEEQPRAEKLVAACKGKVYNLAGRTTLAELAGLLSFSRLHIGVDSAAPHIAAAVGTPTVTIYGPSDWQDWAPIGEQHLVILPERDCVPCHRKGCDGLGVSRCLEELEPEKVQKGIGELLALSSHESGSSRA
jgi:predicted lipopolysaccharide heptosyltransferase III